MSMELPYREPMPGASDVQRQMDERLLAQRIVVITGQLDDRCASDVGSRLMYLDATGDEPVTVRISSRDGSIDAALALIDIVDAMGVPVHTVAVGGVEGAAVGVLAVGHERIASPNARLRLCEESVAIAGHSRALEGWAAAYRDRLGSFAECIARRANHPSDVVLSDLAAGRYLTVNEAVTYGLIDRDDARDAVARGARRGGGRGELDFRAV
jgi:ATP-dependent Clp protease, protease subunit